MVNTRSWCGLTFLGEPAMDVTENEWWADNVSEVVSDSAYPVWSLHPLKKRRERR